MYETLLLVHVVLFACWLGADFSAAYAGRFVANPELTRESRAIAARIMLSLELAALGAMVVMLPTALSLAASGGRLALSWLTLMSVWALASFWLMLVLALQFVGAGDPGGVLRKLDIATRLAVIGGLAWLGASAFVGGGWESERWLSSKILVLAAIVMLTIAIRLARRPFAPAFTELLQQGSTPAVEAALKRSLGASRTLSWLALAGVLLAAALGIYQPRF